MTSQLRTVKIRPLPGIVAPVELPKAAIYTDGACSGNPGPGGWAAVLRYSDRRIIELSGSIAHTTNNRAELQAVIEALRALPGPYKVDLYTDSRYVLTGLDSPGQRVANGDMWAVLVELQTKHTITGYWQAGHAGDPNNERADKLARACIENKPKPTPSAAYPRPQAATLQTVKIWPLIGTAATKRPAAAGAWRLWIFAKNLDKPGLGAIPLIDLIACIKDLGVSPKNQQRWLKQARRLGLIRDRASADGWIALPSPAKVAAILGCVYAGARPARIPAGDLIAPGWRAKVWAAYVSTQNGRPISRAKQEEISGVPASTQRAYDKQAGVIRRPNYAVSNRSAELLPCVVEFENRPAFKIWNSKPRRWVVAWRLPDIRTTSAAESLQRGRSRKINKAIKRLKEQQNNGLSLLGQVVSYDAGGANASRIFYTTDRQAKAARRKLIIADRQPAEGYLLTRCGRRSNLWQFLPRYDELPE